MLCQSDNIVQFFLNVFQILYFKSFPFVCFPESISSVFDILLSYFALGCVGIVLIELISFVYENSDGGLIWT